MYKHLIYPLSFVNLENERIIINKGIKLMYDYSETCLQAKKEDERNDDKSRKNYRSAIASLRHRCKNDLNVLKNFKECLNFLEPILLKEDFSFNKPCKEIMGELNLTDEIKITLKNNFILKDIIESIIKNLIYHKNSEGELLRKKKIYLFDAAFNNIETIRESIITTTLEIYES